MRIVHVAASYGRNPESEIPHIHQDDNHLLIMHEYILVDNCVLFQYKGPTIMYPID